MQKELLLTVLDICSNIPIKGGMLNHQPVDTLLQTFIKNHLDHLYPEEMGAITVVRALVNSARDGVTQGELQRGVEFIVTASNSAEQRKSLLQSKSNT